jgi:transposase-like protein
MFRPPRCPNRRCPFHAAPHPGFYQRRGYYRAKCRAHPVPRFRCRGCRRGFSRQTFRMDYRDHRPDLNAAVFESLASGVGLRQTARNLGLTLRNTELKFRKIARHLRRLNLNLRASLPADAVLQLDELETYEGRRNTRPLSVPVLIESKTRFLIWAESAPIRPRGKMTRARERAIAEDEARLGPRVDRSRGAVRRTLERGAALVRDAKRVNLHTDEKSSYPALAAEAFGAERLEHHTTNSKLARGTWNPLFPINHTEAMARDLMGRLRRESWLVSKRRRYLDLALQMFAAYRNYVRRRFNHDEESPAELLGFTPRRLRLGECLGWRQDWGARSPEPVRRVGMAAAA